MKTTLLLTICLLTTAALAQSTPRTWTDVQGRKVLATFAGLDGEFINLQTSDGQLHRFPFASLSAEDRELAKKLPAPQISVPSNLSAAQAAAKMDALVNKMLVKQGIKPNGPSSDEEFVRRAYLNIAGRIPTPHEAAIFLQDSAPAKRGKLIDMLLDTPGYQSHLYNYFADMFRVRDPENIAMVTAQPYIDWLKEQIATNRPYDRMVYDMLTATGKLWNNGATGYLLRDSGMLLDNLANTFSVFLGTDVACAQCHDHPFSEWTQKQFYELAAFFGATITQVNDQNLENGDPQERIMAQLRELAEKSGGDAKTVEDAAGRVSDIINANRVEVRDIKENRLRLPMDYKYKDGKPGEMVKPKFIRWSSEDRNNDAYRQNRNKEEKLRISFASWMTHPENPRFGITIANRMWQRAFGYGVAEPVRNVDDPKSAANPELLTHLGREMLRLKFNLKEFMRIVYNTQAWQRAATTTPVLMGAPYYFQGPLLRRMTAEQTWDSFMTLVLGNPDAYRNEMGSYYERSIDIDIDKTTGQTMASKLAAFEKLEQMKQEKMGGSIADAGAMKGKILTYNGMRLMRAAELEQPAPPGHFLRDFGQSERMFIDAGHTMGSQPQVLILMNGPVQEMITNPDSLLIRSAQKQDSPAAQVKNVFLTILSRQPTAPELAQSVALLQESPETGSSDLIWSLLTGLEFLFIQ